MISANPYNIVCMDYTSAYTVSTMVRPKCYYSDLHSIYKKAVGHLLYTTHKK